MITLKLVAPTERKPSNQEVNLGASLIKELGKVYPVNYFNLGSFHSTIELVHSKNFSVVLFCVDNLTDRYEIQDQLQNGRLVKYTQGEMAYSILQYENESEATVQKIKNFIDYLLDPSLRKATSRPTGPSVWEEF